MFETFGLPELLVVLGLALFVFTLQVFLIACGVRLGMRWFYSRDYPPRG